jgi:hypothetical protein
MADQDFDEIEDALQDAHERAKRLLRSQKESEEREEQDKEMVEEVEQDLEREQSEIEQAESRRSQKELEKAVEDELSIEKIIEKQEERMKQELKAVEGQLQELDEIFSEAEAAEEAIEEALEKRMNLIEESWNDLQRALNQENSQKIQRNIDRLYEAVVSLGELAVVFREYLELQEELLSGLKREAQENLQLENVIHEIVAEEIGAAESQLEALEIDAEKLNDSEAYEEVGEEEKNLEEIARQVSKEEDEEEKIVEKIKQEIQESNAVIRQEGGIVEEFSEAGEYLEQLEQFLHRESDRIENSVTSEINNTRLLKQVITARDKIREVEQGGRDNYQRSRDMLKDAKKSTKYIWERVKKDRDSSQMVKDAGESAVRWIFRAILVIVGFVVLVFILLGTGLI